MVDYYHSGISLRVGSKKLSALQLMRVMIHGKTTDRKIVAETDTRPAKRLRQDFYDFASGPKLPKPQLDVNHEDISVSAKKLLQNSKLITYLVLSTLH